MTALTAPRYLAARGQSLRRLAIFGAIGVASTLAYVALYAWLRQGLSAGAANAAALIATAVANTAANRRLTFEVKGRSGLGRDHAAGLLALALALAITSVSIGLLTTVAPHHSRATELAVLVAANAAATAARFLLLRFALADRRPSPVPAASRR
jgi:putative flippase GtrA